MLISMSRSPFFNDKHRFSTVVENLISNAIKYHKPKTNDNKHRFIKISGSCNSKALKLQIADNGIGISSQHHEKIYDMYFRLSGQVSGSGIGLYIVKETIQKLQGSISIDSEIGVGTTFTVLLKNWSDK